MAETNITAVAIPGNDTGYALTDSSDFATLSTGAGNGVKFDFKANDIVILKNDTGGAAVFTLIAQEGSSFTTYNAAVTNPTVSVATAKTFVLKLAELFKKVSDGKAYIECDVAGKVLVMSH